MRIDLHVHTLESDGSLTVEEVLNLAHTQDINVLAITDHESTEGISRAKKLAKHHNIEIIPGVELLTNFQGEEVHLLGYFKDISSSLLQTRLSELRYQRTTLAYEMVKSLQKGGLAIEWKDVEREVGSVGAVSKGHIMRAIYNRYSEINPKSWQDIAAYFRPGGIAYLPYLKHRFEDAVDLIFNAGGLPVVAHPGLLRQPNIVFDLLRYRPIGLEVYYGYWEQQRSLISYYAKVAAQFALLATGGSDYHGPFGQIQIGQMDVPVDGVNKLRILLDRSL
ncbi:putative metal-dependent phosphoesterase, PHP family [Desulfosporosinus acidiphilus SJ4]|uniref:Putative metal-dependent phosphoesterase, PHP family n=1 Tax=Desulfosporosinus acidiphilus (strain DSM 22704 / JCM 16185 / SJ4) TaxID=646529 RepID=I4D808_DESAJ|nr:PHP domain-containing protein [Desulfosporosinus acidiphilus]AFM41932.1 putative metal-dependent phosphoesterase, PHP family [Desulfosporosinus acidiphilus SJ4]